MKELNLYNTNIITKEDYKSTDDIEEYDAYHFNALQTFLSTLFPIKHPKLQNNRDVQRRDSNIHGILYTTQKDKDIEFLLKNDPQSFDTKQFQKALLFNDEKHKIDPNNPSLLPNTFLYILDNTYWYDNNKYMLDWNYYPFFNKEQTLKDIETLHFNNAKNKDFFIFDIKHKEDGLFATYLYCDVVLSYIERIYKTAHANTNSSYNLQWKYNTAKENAMELNKLANYKKQETALKKACVLYEELQTFLTNNEKLFNDTLKIFDDLISMQDTYKLDGFIYPDFITKQTNYNNDNFNIVNKFYNWFNKGKNKQWDDFEDKRFLKYFISDNFDPAKSDFIFSFQDFKDGLVSKIINSLFEDLKKINVAQILDCSVAKESGVMDYANLILFISNIVHTLFYTVVISFRKSINYFIKTHKSTLKPFKHFEIILKEVLNNFKLDTLNAINKKDEYVIYHNSSKFLNIMQVASIIFKTKTYQDYNFTHPKLKNEYEAILDSFLNKDFNKDTLDVPSLDPAFSTYFYYDVLKELVKHIKTDQRFKLKNNDDFSDGYSDDEYTFVVGNLELDEINNILQKSVQKNISDQVIRPYVLFRKNEDEIMFMTDYNNAPWYKTLIRYASMDQERGEIPMNRIAINNLNSEVNLSQTDPYFNTMKEETINSRTQINNIDELKAFNDFSAYFSARENHLLSFFSNNQKNKNTLYLASLVIRSNYYNEYRWQMDLYGKSIESNNIKATIENKLPLLKKIDIEDDKDIKILKKLTNDYYNIAYMTINFLLNDKNTFYYVKTNEQVLSKKNQYKQDNGYEEAIKRNSQKILSALNNENITLFEDKQNNDEKKLRR